ncbi:MAG: DUF192 domain-containing protein [Halobacteriales archaeon]
MQVRHEGEPLATDVEVARSLPARIRGLIGRRSVPENYALVFPFDDPTKRAVHMLFVRRPLDVVWVSGDQVTRRATLSPWTGLAWSRADTIIELAAGAASDVAAGDRVTLAGSD